jgi:hypothetical protein
MDTYQPAFTTLAVLNVSGLLLLTTVRRELP